MKLIDADEALRRLEVYNTADRMDHAHYKFTRDFIIEQPEINIIIKTHEQAMRGLEEGRRRAINDALY